jgi:hypothetical protein
MVTAGAVTTVSEIARQAGVSRRFIYAHPDLLAHVHAKAAASAGRFAGGIAAGARVSALSLRTELEAAKAANGRLRQERSILEARLSRVLGTEVAAELADRGVLSAAEDRRADVEGLRARVVELEDLLRRREEELSAARALNRNLIAEMNRQHT